MAVAAHFDPHPGLLPIGYWIDVDQPDLPDPATLIDESWSAEEREQVAAILGATATHEAGAGCSRCRICGAPNGFTDLTNGTHVWPEGLAHYVRDHAVRLPDDIVARLVESPNVTVVKDAE